MNYTVLVKGARPPDLARKITEAHAGALKSKHCSHPRGGKDITKSKPELAVLESADNEDLFGEGR